MLNFFSNLWVIGLRIPGFLAALRMILDIFGSEVVQSTIEAVKDAILKQKEIDGQPTTEPERRRFFDRVRRRLAFGALGMTETQYVAFCNIQGVAGISEQLA
jgi:hypothetical protein